MLQVEKAWDGGLLTRSSISGQRHPSQQTEGNKFSTDLLTRLAYDTGCETTPGMRGPTITPSKSRPLGLCVEDGRWENAHYGNSQQGQHHDKTPLQGNHMQDEGVPNWQSALP